MATQALPVRWRRTYRKQHYGDRGQQSIFDQNYLERSGEVTDGHAGGKRAAHASLRYQVYSGS